MTRKTNNYRPTIFLYKEKLHTPDEEERRNRRCRRNLEREVADGETKKKEIEEKNLQFSVLSHSYCLQEGEGATEVEELNATVMEVVQYDDTDIKSLVENGVQTDPDPLFLENQELRKELKECREELKKCKWGHKRIEDDDVSTKFYTGLPTYAVFLWLFRFMQPKAMKMTYWTGSRTTPSVMADKGFTIQDLLEKRKCTLNIPPFRGMAPQFTTEEVFETQQIAELKSLNAVERGHSFQ